MSDFELPDPNDAAERLIEFISWFGSGDVYDQRTSGPPCNTEDIEAVVRAYRSEALA